MSPALAILCCAVIEYAMEHLGELVGFVVRCMDDVFDIYGVGNDAEEELVRGYFGVTNSCGLTPHHWCSMWSQFWTRISSGS